jgi:nicotinamidase/pyrazinamidase
VADPTALQQGDALVIVDMQRDFLPGGSLGVPDGDAVVPVINSYAEKFRAAGLPVAATRDWHPPDHCSFEAQGGTWPPHCVRDTAGAEFADTLQLPPDFMLISKATKSELDAYSGFDGTDLAERLRVAGVRRVFVGGLATEYCVLATVRDARAAGFEVGLLADAVRAVNVDPGDGERALDEMRSLGASTVRLRDLDVAA